MDRTTGANYKDVAGKRQFTDVPPATAIGADFLNAVQEEIVGAIEASGQTPSPYDLTQLYQAISRTLTAQVYMDTGAVNALAITASGYVSYKEPMYFLVKVANANTGVCTLNVNGMGAIPVVANDGLSRLSANSFVASAIAELVYNGSKFILINSMNVTSAFGYFGGGKIGAANTDNIDGIQFSDETAINPAATLSVARNHLAGVNSALKGYFGGGHVVAVSDKIDGIQFSDESAISLTAVLGTAREGLAGVNSASRGYFGGGFIAARSAEIDGIQFSDDTAINPAAVLNVARDGLAGVNSALKGYFGGGSTGVVSDEIDGIQFSDEAAINPAAVLSVGRTSLAGVNSSIRGYFGGGSAAGGLDEIDGIQFSDETAINPAATLSAASYLLAGVQSGCIL